MLPFCIYIFNKLNLNFAKYCLLYHVHFSVLNVLLTIWIIIFLISPVSHMCALQTSTYCVLNQNKVTII